MATKQEKIKSGDYCKCGHCGYEGYAYGSPGSRDGKAIISAPWCQRCGINSKLSVVEAPNGD